MTTAQQSILVGGRPVAGYRTITADPPWRYDDSGVRGAAEHHYETMSTAEICALPVGRLGAENSHLYLWVTNSFIEDGFDVLRAWGYRYITAITWIKDKIGCGHYFRNTTEHVLFGVRGSAALNVANLPTHFEAKRGEHSAKPTRFYEIVEQASNGPFLELFARGEMRPGWTGWGDQARGDVIAIDGSSRYCTGVEFVEGVASLAPRTDTEIKEIVEDSQ